MKFWKFFFTLCMIYFSISLLFNQSILKYLEQKYHWEFSQEDNSFNQLLVWFSQPTVMLSDKFEELLPKASTLGYKNIEENQSQLSEVIQEETSEIPPRISIENDKLVIRDYATFLFIGDSMMQGVSMTLTPKLQKQNIQVIDLAKQSTGLTYSKFFNWPEVLENTLNENLNIDVIVVMLGANDPWNIGKLKFQTPEWDEVYSQRIQRIYELAKERQIFIFWYEIPVVKNPKLNTRISHLNELYEQEAMLNRAFFIKTNFLFAPQGIYTPDLQKDNNTRVKIRASDGIHFSIAGSRLLSDLLIEKLEVIQEKAPDEESFDEVNKNIQRSEE
ncbi:MULTISPECIES: SGNH/GDSL hydrolase family protein [unclassified Helicobacter]|uniref:SGNH/GDSL hydrolase family protein n=1 Tax=unclassified Helicobacter TaxID=2593540 RepID=UPI000CF183FE|nr:MULTISPECIES: GDSL-type esterase/lipase family protein [unclassified Helicobacter]